MKKKNVSIVFDRYKQQNFYTSRTEGCVILKSYNTIVGFIDDNWNLYRVRYTRTTGKQLTKYYRENYLRNHEYYVTPEKLHDIIKENTGLDINTEYDGCLYAKGVICF